MPHADITTLKTERGLALQDLISGVYEILEDMELSAQSKIYLLDQVAMVE